MGISASHLDSLSVTATPDATGGAPSRPKGPPSADPQAAEFRKLFARVFGEKMRQDPAGSAPASADKTAIAGHEGATPAAAQTWKGSDAEGSESPKASQGPANGLEPLRSLQIGRATQIITAGSPLSEEDLVRFAREAELDEASISALLASQNGLVGLHSGIPLSGVSSSALSDHSAGQAFLGQPPIGSPIGLKNQGQAPASMLGSGANGPSGLTNPGTAAFAVTVSTPDAAVAQPLATSAWVQSRSGDLMNPEATAPKPVASLTQEMAEGEEASADGPRKDGFLEKGLTLRLDFQNGSIKERLKKLLGPEALKSMQTGQPHGVRLESLVLYNQSVAEPSAGSEGTSSASTQSTSSLLGAATGSSTGGGTGSGGQGGGSEGGRPDANAQSGQARGLPQQVMQRFGELLGQRLLQQVSQGNWRVELDLEPGDLGSIRIELELRKGEIEASIKASQASTRELLQESLPRLRETLERNGMDVASLSVGQQDRRQSGGQSSSGRQGSGQQALAEDSSAEAITGPSQSSRPDDGRLDVWA